MKKAKCPSCGDGNLVARFDAYVDYSISDKGVLESTGNITETEGEPLLECFSCFKDFDYLEIEKANPGLSTEFIK